MTDPIELKVRFEKPDKGTLDRSEESAHEKGVDLEDPESILDLMRADGHRYCVIDLTSFGRAWAVCDMSLDVDFGEDCVVAEVTSQQAGQDYVNAMLGQDGSVHFILFT